MTIEEAIRARLLAMTAVSAITTTVRVDQLDQRDNPDTTDCLLIHVDQEEFEEQDISGSCDVVRATVTVSAISSNRTRTRLLAEAVRTNGTNPGTGLQGYRTRGGAVDWDAMLEKRITDIVPNADGSDSGLSTTDSIFTVMYYETR